MAIKTFKRKATIPFDYDLDNGTVLHFQLPGQMSIAAMLKGRELSKLSADTAIEDVDGIFDFFRALLTNDVVDELMKYGLGAEDLMEISTWYQSELEAKMPQQEATNPKQKAVTKKS